MPNRTTRTGIAAALLLVPVLLTGCSAVGPASHPSTSHESSQREMLAKLTSCLRDKGYDVADDDMRPPAGVDGTPTSAMPPMSEGQRHPQCRRRRRRPGRGEAGREGRRVHARGGVPDFPDDPGAQASTTGR